MTTFLFESMNGKYIFEFLTFKIQKFLTISDGQMIKTKVEDLEKLWDFVVDNFSFEYV